MPPERKAPTSTSASRWLLTTSIQRERSSATYSCSERRSGLTNFGVNHTKLAPGAVTALRHHHSRQDEFIYVVSGTPTLVTETEERLLEPGMCVGFKAGDPNSHHFVNKSAQEVILLEVGDRTAGDSVTYPHDDIQATLIDGQWRFTHKDGQPY